MKETKRIAFATGSRADYGIARNYLRLLDSDENIELSILVTGALLSREFGHQVDLIYRDDFHVAVELEIDVNPTSNAGVLHSMALALDKFGEYFSTNLYDLVIILGDRYEIFSAATAAAMNRIPILHIHGGEATFGNYDEFIRHSITKMSLFHFTATEEYRNRVIQLGEAPERVFNLGALGAENCLFIDENAVSKELLSFQNSQYFVVLFHPETLTDISIEYQIQQVLSAISYFKDRFKYVFLGSNADTHSDIIRNRVKEFVNLNCNCMYRENLSTNDYHFLLMHSLGLIGNSSSGLIEAPSLHTYTINIGYRQDGRVRGNSVYDVPWESHEIQNAIQLLIDRPKEKAVNPYYQKDTAMNYYNTTKRILDMLKKEVDYPKKFWDFDRQNGT